MSSSIPTNQTQDNNEIENEMANDNDNHIVDEIITEMGVDKNDTGNDNESQYQMDQENQFNRQIDPSSNMMAPDDMGQYDGDIEPEYNNIDVKSSSGFSKEIIINILKEPLIVSIISLLIHNPIVSKLLTKYLPIIFNTGSGVKQYLGVGIKALLAGIIFYIIKALFLK